VPSEETPKFGASSLVIDPDTGAMLSPKQTGEIFSRGPQIFLGYWKKPEATAAAFIDVGDRSCG
jgi:fatty-acyl-CoA synthase